MYDGFCCLNLCWCMHSFHAYYPHRPFPSCVCNLINYYTVIAIAIDIVVTTLNKLTHTTTQKKTASTEFSSCKIECMHAMKRMNKRAQNPSEKNELL